MIVGSIPPRFRKCLLPGSVCYLPQKAQDVPPQPPKKTTPPSRPLVTKQTLKSKDTSAAKSQYSSHTAALAIKVCRRTLVPKTIEGDLEEALFHAGAVPENDRGIPKRYDWARSARTDKGVSAVGQVVSGRFYIDPPGLVERLHSNLSPQFRIFGYKRVTGSFNAKKFCDRRRYVYLIPVFALNPCSHRDRESVLASLGSGSELVKCLECSERGRKVVGALGKRSFESKSDVSPTEIRSNDKDTTLKAEIKEEVSALTDNGDGVIRNFESVNEIKVLRNEDSVTTESGISSNSEDANANPEIKDEIMVSIEKGDDKNTKSEEEAINGSGFCYEEKEKERFNRILNYYVGSHNFHNFTTRTKAEDPSAKRFIVSFDAKTTVTVEGIEFVKCEVVGQSFMLHQIRKMIGAAVAIMRNCASESLIQTALQKDVNITVPTAPEVGLYLDECFFTSYNQKWKDSHEELSMKDYEEEAEEFKMKHIYSHIAATEHKEGSVALWLHSLNHRNYPDLQVCGNGDNITSEDNNGKESTTVESMAESTAL
ncbi:hypothetical protein OIU77_020267 [Salix suchowensis]|nr:hypothetical protein OIU77_020267 [Salix suchowensis]